MLVGYHPVFQALLGTLLTWGLTAAGSALVFVFASAQFRKFGLNQRTVLDGSLGFAAGVMTAASYWSLLAPAIEMAESSGSYGSQGQWAFVPVAIGFFLGAVFVYAADKLLPYFGISDPTTAFALQVEPKVSKELPDIYSSKIGMGSDDSGFVGTESRVVTTNPAQRRRATMGQGSSSMENGNFNSSQSFPTASDNRRSVNWKRILLLIVAITIHNIPEGLAVGVGFGAIGKSPSATFETARNLAIGIGIQNFPEGLAVSLPLRGSGMSVWKSFWYGQLSGMVEPIAGLFGAIAVVIAEPILPYALAFAAGAMIYVVVDDIIPEAQTCGNGTLASWGAVVGFIVMMSLDVGLG